jgi:hypothetical protein
MRATDACEAIMFQRKAGRTFSAKVGIPDGTCKQ